MGEKLPLKLAFIFLLSLLFHSLPVIKKGSNDFFLNYFLFYTHDGDYVTYHNGVKETLERFPPQNPYLKEGGGIGVQTFSSIIPFSISAFLLKIFGWKIYIFISNTIYFFVCLLSSVFFFSQFNFFTSIILSFLIFLSHPYSLARPVASQFFIPIFFFWFISMKKFLDEGKYKNLIYSSILVGISFYVYPYLWMTILPPTILALIKRRKGFDREGFNIIFPLLMIFFLSLPYFAFNIYLSSKPGYDDVLVRNGLINSRIPLIMRGEEIQILYLVSAIVLSLFSKQKLFFLTLISIFIVRFSPIITQKEYALWHIVERNIFFISASLLYLSRDKSNKIKYLSTLIFILWFFISPLWYNEMKVATQRVETQKFKEFYDMVNSVKGEVIWYNFWRKNDFIFHIRFVSENYPFFTHALGFNFISQEEFMERLLMELVTAKDIQSIDDIVKFFAEQYKLIHDKEYAKYRVMKRIALLCEVIGKAVKKNCEIRSCYLVDDKVSCEAEELKKLFPQYYNSLLLKYTEIKNNFKKYLQKYNIKYLLIQDEEEIEKFKSLSVKLKLLKKGKYFSLWVIE